MSQDVMDQGKGIRDLVDADTEEKATTQAAADLAVATTSQLLAAAAEISAAAAKGLKCQISKAAITA